MPHFISHFLCTVSEKLCWQTLGVGKKAAQISTVKKKKNPEGISGAQWSTYKMRHGKPRRPGHTKFILGKWGTVHNVCLGLSFMFSPLQVSKIFIAMSAVAEKPC